jgi:hypothetical protein
MKTTKSLFIAIGLLCATNVCAHFEDSPYVYCHNNPVNAIDPDGRQVKIINGPDVLPILQNTVPQECRSYIALNQNGFVDMDLLKQGLLNPVACNSSNYMDLVNITENQNIVEISAPIDKVVKDGNGNIVSGTDVPLPFQNPVSDIYNNFTPELQGSLGVTLAPDSHSWTKNDLVQRNKLSASKMSFSPNENYQVQINGRGLKFPSTHLDLSRVLAHELYGHLNFMFKGIDALHTQSRNGANSNINLEKHIQNAVNEVEIYNHE